jgi:hypothetical protein
LQRGNNGRVGSQPKIVVAAKCQHVALVHANPGPAGRINPAQMTAQALLIQSLQALCNTGGKIHGR